MSGEVTIRIPPRRGERRRGAAVGAPVAAGGADAPPSPPPERIPRVARVLALAHHWRGLIQLGRRARPGGPRAARRGVAGAGDAGHATCSSRAADPGRGARRQDLGPGVEKGLRSVAQHAMWAEQRRALLKLELRITPHSSECSLAAR